MISSMQRLRSPVCVLMLQAASSAAAAALQIIFGSLSMADYLPSARDGF
jgi:hypothetical protein